MPRNPCYLLSCMLLLAAGCSPPPQVDPLKLPPAVLPELRPGDVLLDAGAVDDKDWLGFGWSRAERARGGQTYRWLKHLEGDVYPTLETPAPVRLWLSVRPMYIHWRRQAVGLYVNGKYVTEWVCPDSPDWAVFEGEVPAHFWKPGRNRISLRAAYRRHHRTDKRELAFGLDRILLRPL